MSRMLGIVHAGLLATRSAARSRTTKLQSSARAEAKEIRIWQPDPDGTGQGAHVSYHYEVQGR